MTINYFNLRAREWDDDPGKIERAKVFANEIDDFIKPGGKLDAFEFGCGTGLLSYYLRNSFKAITLADNSEGMVEVLKAKIKRESISNFTPLLIDLFTNDFARYKYDVVYTLMTLHHVREIEKLLHIFYLMLKPGGYLCIADLEKEDGSFHSHQQDFDGHYGFERVELSMLLRSKGFEIELSKLCSEIEKVVDNQPKKYPLFLMIGRK